MAAANFATENRTYRQLLGNGLTYRVPRFQRDYSWDDEQWEDLWDDLFGVLTANEPVHYMGYLVLQTADNRMFDVIDGQQRLTTASLMVLAAMRLLKKLVGDDKDALKNQQRLDQLRASYVGYIDPVTLTPTNKLVLNRNNDSYYRDYVVSLSDHLPSRGFPTSTHAMRKGYEWFERRLREHVKSQPDPGMALASFVESMSDKLLFTVISVADELNAYRVFETLNARGVRLSTTDLLKNYLFSILARDGTAQEDMAELERRWDGMVGRLGGESFPDFLRMHWNSRQSFARQSELFKVIRGRIRDRESVFALLRDMDSDIDAYLALTQPPGSSWPPEWRQCAEELRMFSVRQPYPMLIAGRRKLSDTEFLRLLKATVVITFRYNVIGAQQAAEQERAYHSVAMSLLQMPTPGVHDVLAALRPVYRTDDVFRADFAEKTIKTTQHRNAKIVRYILSKLERQSSGQDVDMDSPSYTIEHILPQKPGQGWEQFTDIDLDNFIYRLGNMVMLDGSRNRQIANKSYGDKRPILQSSDLAQTRNVAERYEEWTADTVQQRQKAMARVATSIWRIDELS